MSFEAIETAGVEAFLEQLRDELLSHTYRPMRNRKKEIPKDGGKKVRVLSIPSIRDRVVQGALKLILEPIFEADFQPGSYGYCPKRTAHEAVHRVAEAIVKNKTRVIDVDLSAYFDNVRHHLLLEKVARRIDDVDVMALLKMMLKASGDKGVPQGGVISPLLSNLYLNEVDRMLEKAKEVTRQGKYTYLEYVRFADDLVILVDAYRRHDWLLKAVDKRLREELAHLQVEVNEEKSRVADLEKGESFGFLGFDFRRVRSLKERLSELRRRGTSPRGQTPRALILKHAQRAMASAVHAKTEEEDCTAGETQGRVPTLSVSTCGPGGVAHQPGAAGVGELLLHRAVQPVLQLRARLGGEEGTAAPDACPETAGLRLEEVE